MAEVDISRLAKHLNATSLVIGLFIGAISSSFGLYQENQVAGYTQALLLSRTARQMEPGKWMCEYCNASFVKPLPSFSVSFSTDQTADSISSVMPLKTDATLTRKISGPGDTAWVVEGGLPGRNKCVRFSIRSSGSAPPVPTLKAIDPQISIQDPDGFNKPLFWNMYQAAPSWLGYPIFSLVGGIILLALVQLILTVFRNNPNDRQVDPPEGD